MSQQTGWYGDFVLSIPTGKVLSRVKIWLI